MATAKVKTNERGEALVTVMLPITKDQTKAEFVSVNERTWLVPRGVPSEVPECAAKVLEESNREMIRAIAYQNKKRKG